MTPTEFDILIHALGLDEEHFDSRRNQYVTDACDPAILALVEAGMMFKPRQPSFLAEGEANFMVTEHGIAVAMVENRRRNPPPTRSQKRYLRWLGISDVEPDLRFGDFLRHEKNFRNPQGITP